MKKLLAFAIGLTLAGVFAPTTLAQDLSQQVLRLLTRNNYWSGTQTFGRTVGVTLESGSVAPVLPTNSLYNIGGVLYWNGNVVASPGGVGTVTSVDLTMPNVFGVAGGPITTSGTFAVSLTTQTANRVWAGPTTGSAAAPTFRALVAADIPNNPTIACTDCVSWTSVNKTGSNLANLATRSATDLTSGTLPDARFPATLPAASGVNLTALNATQLTSGTVPAARMPAFTGDATSSAGAVALTLANSGVSAGSYGSGSLVPVITVDAKGRITAISTSAATPGGTVAVANGGTNITSYTVGDTIQATGATTLTKVTSVATGNAWISGGVATANAWGKIGLTTHISGVLPCANGGTGLSATPANGQLLIGNASCYTLALLTGTANQINVAVGAGTITLSTPQAIGTGSTPQFARMGLGTGAGAVAVITTTGLFDTGLFDAGNSGAAITITWTNGMTQKVTLTANTTFTFQNPTAAGTWFRLQLIQDGTGSRTATWPGMVIWSGGSAPTLSTVAASKDLLECLYDGTSYICRLLKVT